MSRFGRDSVNMTSNDQNLDFLFSLGTCRWKIVALSYTKFPSTSVFTATSTVESLSLIATCVASLRGLTSRVSSGFNAIGKHYGTRPYIGIEWVHRVSVGGFSGSALPLRVPPHGAQLVARRFG